MPGSNMSMASDQHTFVPAAHAPAARLRPWMLGLIVALAFAFIGSRGIWDPDEGRYTNVALNMLETGNWADPMRHQDVGHWTKPPLTYWAIASSVALFGRTPGAARLPMALAYLACAWLAWATTRRLAPGSESFAAIAYATMLLPFGASQLVTTDFLLAALQGFAMLAFVEARFGAEARARAWLRWMWLGFALAFLAKGPPALLPLLAILAFDALVRTPRRLPLASPADLALFCVTALPWFVVVGARHPGLIDYFVGAEVYARVATDRFDRHGEWYGWLQVYAPTLLLGTMPWTFLLWRWLRKDAPRLRSWRDAHARRADAPLVLLVLWIAIPLLVFCVARSRLPLYLLPLFVPLAVLAARQRFAESARLPSAPMLAAWCVFLLALKLAAAAWPTHKDAAAWADAVRERVPYRVEEVVFVEDMARYGLHMHLGATVEKIALRTPGESGFNPEFDETLAEELAEREPGVLWVARQDDWPAVQHAIAARGYDATVNGPPFDDRVMFSVAAARARPGDG
jgi:4-amino-4-deoxy-L-arabinose transferase-like glycosyltransferase